MHNKTLHLTEVEWFEYGNPMTDEDAAKMIASICPVRNINSSGPKPDTLVRGALDDPSVPF
jgi:protease II